MTRHWIDKAGGWNGYRRPPGTGTDDGLDLQWLVDFATSQLQKMTVPVLQP
jgi:hypothetical protein